MGSDANFEVGKEDGKSDPQSNHTRLYPALSSIRFLSSVTLAVCSNSYFNLALEEPRDDDENPLQSPVFLRFLLAKE